MSEDAEKKEDAIHRVETVPPPPGEGDAYSAPTTVGPINPAVIEAMRKAGVPEDLIPSSRPPASAPISGAQPIETRLEQPSDLPRLYDAGIDDQGEAATVLHPSTGKVPLALPIPVPAPISAPLVAPRPRAESIPDRRFDSPRIVALVVVATLAVATFVAFLASLR